MHRLCWFYKYRVTQPPLQGQAPAWRLHSQQKSFLAGDRISSFSDISSKEAAPSATHAVCFRGSGCSPLAASLQINRQPAGNQCLLGRLAEKTLGHCIGNISLRGRHEALKNNVLFSLGYQSKSCSTQKCWKIRKLETGAGESFLIQSFEDKLSNVFA